MSKNLLTSIMGLILIFSFSLFAQEKGAISGKVTDAKSGEALIGVNMIVIGTTQGFTTDVNGAYKYELLPGTYTVRVSFVGYESKEASFTIKEGKTIKLDFALKPSPLQLQQELVVIGSRTLRTVTASPVPVDVISSAEIQKLGFTQVDQVLSYVAPSFNASPQTISDGTDHINPASLRGLGPDQVLVLINGKRFHTSALVNVNGTFGRGTVGTDFNAIPTSAIDRIEVLRDGASAQYGSDAIAGVINIVLKKSTNANIIAQSGVTGEGDGEQVKAGINYGFKVGEKGFFNVTGEFLERARTNRSSTWTGPIFTPDGKGDPSKGILPDDQELAKRGLTRDDFTMKTGQSQGTYGQAFFNTVVQTSDNSQFYAFGGISHRKGTATGFFRLPFQEERVVPSIYPNGFLPEIHTEIADRNFTGGLRGNANGWDYDFSVTRGSNSVLFNIENTNNASMGDASPTTFNAGRLNFRQTSGNFDLVKLIDTKGALKSLSLVIGGEFRVENYEIERGDDASWMLGNGGSRPGIDFDTTSTGAPKAPGSQVFPGFRPSNEVDRYRNSISGYVGLETQVNDQFLFDVGGRFERYSDFGNTVNGKFATRVAITKEFALRGAISTGFRAPSLHQVWFNNVSTQFILNTTTGSLDAKQVLTSNNQSRVTKAFGIPDLKEETSLNVSAGFTAEPFSGFTFSGDFYYITIDDRIVLSSRFSSSNAQVAKILAPFASQGVSSAQFFANAVDTRTTGVDLVASYSAIVGQGGFLTITGSANFTNTDVLRVNVPSTLLTGLENTLFNREERNRLEDALPRQKANLSVRYSIDKFAVTTRANYFGKVEYKPTNPANDETFGAKVLIDLDLSYELIKGLTLSAGANNIFNTFPDKQQIPGNISNGRFVYSRRVTQFGMNGGFYYGRLQLSL